MSATVINGIWSSGAVFQNAVVGQATAFTVLIPNTQNVTVTLNSAALSGLHAADYSVNAGQFPVVLNPNQSAIIQVNVTPGGTGLRQATLTIATSVGGYSPQVSLKLAGLNAGNNASYGDPYTIVFPTTKVGQTSKYLNFSIVNFSNVAATVTALAFGTGTDFAFVGAPVLPFNIPAGGASPVFEVDFIPIATGTRVDTVLVTVGGVPFISSIQGQGSALQSAFTLNGSTVGCLFAFPGSSAPLVLAANPTNLNCEEPGSFARWHDVGLINQEKEVLRIRGHYEDLGPAVITWTLNTRRLGQPNQSQGNNPPSFGTAAADGWPRDFVADVNGTAEIFQLICSRAANAGPVSIIDYEPCVEPKGEKIEGV